MAEKGVVMIREEPGAGFLLLIAAGITMLIGAVVPWAQLAHPLVRFSALQMHLYSPFAVAIITGLALVGFALARTMWASFVGAASALIAMLLVLAVHSDVYVGLHVAAPSLAYTDAAHLTGFGVAVFFAAGLLGGAGGMVTVVQTAPKVITSRRPQQQPTSGATP